VPPLAQAVLVTPITSLKVSSCLPYAHIETAHLVAIELRNKSTAWISSLQNAATDLIDSASDGIKSVSSRIPEVKLPDIDTPQFLKDLFTFMENG
jgi:hypothetical protein